MNKFDVTLLTILLVMLLTPLTPREKTKTEKKTEELFKMSLEELMNVKVTRANITRQSCSKTFSLILLKIISMDKNIGRLGNPIDIGVSSNNLYITLKSLENKLKINGKPFIAHKITSLKTAAQFKIIYLGKDWGRNTLEDMETLADNGAFIFCVDEKSVLFGHASVLFKVVDKYPHVALNLENAREQGADFQEEDLDAIVVIRKD